MHLDPWHLALQHTSLLCSLLPPSKLCSPSQFSRFVQMFSASVQAFPKREKGGRRGTSRQVPDEAHLSGQLQGNICTAGLPADTLPSRSDRCSQINQFTAGRGLESFQFSETRSGLEKQREAISERELAEQAMEACSEGANEMLHSRELWHLHTQTSPPSTGFWKHQYHRVPCS